MGEYLGSNHENLPQLFIAEQVQAGLNKYKLEEREFTKENVEKFINDFKAKKLQKYTKSEEIPATQDSSVIQIVQKTYGDLVINSKKDVLLEFYAPWCHHCK